jgi:hypothetical protein
MSALHVSNCVLNIHACYISASQQDSELEFIHRERYNVNLLDTLETFLLGIATRSDPEALSSSSPSSLIVWYVQ